MKWVGIVVVVFLGMACGPGGPGEPPASFDDVGTAPDGDDAATPPDVDGGTPRDGGRVTPPDEDAGTLSDVAWPIPEWSEADASAMGFDPVGLDEAARFAESIDSKCLLVVQDGHLVYERYWNGVTRETPNASWSVAKSFTSTLVGIALSRGEISSVEQPAADFLPSWVGTDKEAITIRHLLSMTSGLEFDFIADYGSVIFTDDMSAGAIGLPLDDAPGAVWNYNNRAVQVLESILEAATGLDVEEYASTHLWRPLGMQVADERAEGTHWERDGAGNVTTFANVRASCRDMARLGYLYLRRGAWGETRILDEGFVERATTASQELNRGYGWLFWVNAGAPAYDAGGEAFDGPILPAAPPDAFGAQGFGQNFIDVIPSTGTVLVHMRDAPHDPPSRLLLDLGGTISALLEDAARGHHRELNRLLMDAMTRP